MPELTPENIEACALGLLIVMTMTGAVLAVSLRKVFHNLLGFGLSMIGAAGVTLILGSEFVALKMPGHPLVDSDSDSEIGEETCFRDMTDPSFAWESKLYAEELHFV